MNRIKIINSHTGEVREVDATKEGVNTLIRILNHDSGAYSHSGYLKGRNFKEDFIVESDVEEHKILLDNYIDKLSKQLI